MTVPSLVWLMLARVLDLISRLSGRRIGLVLVYHAVAERNGDPERELVPAHGAAVLEDQLRRLTSRYRVVRAVELLEAVRDRRRGDRLPVAVTFDDDLASHLEMAAPILRRAGVPATFFLCGATLGDPYSFWWQRLQRAADLGRPLPFGAEGIHEQAERIEAMSPSERTAVGEMLAAELDPEPADQGLRAVQARQLVSAGFDIGFHTLRHDRLTGLDDAPLAAALSDGRAELEAVVGRRLQAISYPHGKADRRVADAARQAGFAFGFTGRYEPVEGDSEPLELGRIEPTFGDGSAFELQLARALLMRRHR